MAYYRAQLDVRRPIDEVFAYLADFSNTQEWDPGVVSARKRVDGAVTMGARFKVVSKFTLLILFSEQIVIRGYSTFSARSSSLP